jgi:hypothetical protein
MKRKGKREMKRKKNEKEEKMNFDVICFCSEGRNKI